MVCKMVKKGVLGAALTAGALYLAFGTHAPSYVHTALHKARHSVKGAVPIQFDIERARDEIANLAPAIDNNKEDLARAEVDVEHLQREITTVRGNLEAEKKLMVSLREDLTRSDLRLAKNGRDTTGEVRAELAGRLDHYRNVTRILEEKETTLHARQKAVTAARQKLTEMAMQKSALASKLEAIQARLQAIEATQDRNEFNFDDSALSRAKQTVSDLERRLEVKARIAEMDGHFSGTTVRALDANDRDVVREFDEQFGPSSKSKDSGDKSL